MLSIRDFSFQYHGSEAYSLRDINMNITDGEFIGIIGGSGAGKSTLAYALTGVIPHHYRGNFYGEITVEGMDTVENRPEMLAADIGLVMQDIEAQMVASTVEDELLFGLENFGVSHRVMEQRIKEALDMVGIGDLRYRSINTLSGGQKQKAAIAAIAALKPKIMILDEPTGELDPKSSIQIFEMLKKMNREYGMTIIVIEQKIMLLSEYVQRLVVLENGTIAFDDTVKHVVQNSSHLEKIGVNCPRVTTLYQKLKQRGMTLRDIPVTVKEAAELVGEQLC